MTNPYRAMCAELADLLERSASVLSTYAFDKLASQGVAAAHRARVLLAQSEPEGLPMPSPGDAEGLAEVFWAQREPQPPAAADSLYFDNISLLDSQDD